MIYAYLRISDKKQNLERQRHTFQKFIKKRNLKQEIIWIEEIVSGTKDWKKREIGNVIEKIGPNDIFITDEVSRIGRNILDVLAVLGELMKKKTQVFIINQNYEFKDDLQSQMFAFAFSIASQIERDLISSRTKTGLAAAKAKGTKLGRPKGSKSKQSKLDEHRADIETMLSNGVSKSAIARTLKVARGTINVYIKEVLGR